MSLAPILLTSSLLGLVAPTQAPRITTTWPGADSLPAPWIAANPDQARDSLRRWLTGTADPRAEVAGELLARSTMLAEVYLRVWGDSFPLREVRRFEAWPRALRARRIRADSLRRAGNVALGAAGLEGALREWRASYAIGRELGDTASMAAALGNMGAGYYREGALDSAEALFAQARRFAEVAGDRRTMLNALGGLGSVYKDRGELRAAAAAYTQAMALRRAIGDYRGVAADANNLGLVALALGDVAEARRRHTEALITAREHSLDEAAAAALVNLGALAADAGEEALARSRYLEALGLYQELGSASDEALVLHNLGLIDASRGNYREAVGRYQAAAAIVKRTGPVERAVATRRDLAMVFAAMGQPEQAGAQLAMAIALAQPGALGPGASARLQLARGDLALQFHRIRSAAAAYSEALSGFRIARDGAGEADALAALGSLRLVQADYAAARRLLSDALTRQQALGDRRLAALTRLALSDAQRGMADTAGAGENIATALAALRTLEDPVAEAWAHCQAGAHAEATGLPLAAEASYRAGLARLGRRPVLDVSLCLSKGLGGTLAARGAWPEAIAVYARGVSAIELSAGHVSAPGSRGDFLTDKWSLYADLALAQHAAGRDSAAFATSERLRARQALEGVSRGPATSPGVPATPRAEALRRRISALMALAEGSGSTVALRGADALGQFTNVEREALARAQDAYVELLDSLEAARAREDRSPPASTPGWREVAADLRPTDALIEYLVTDSAVIAFVVTPERLATIALPVTGLALASEIDFLRGALMPAGGGLQTTWQAPLRRMHQQLIAPLEEAGLLQGRRRLILVPHRELHYLPFAALLGGGRNERYLVEQYELGTVSSAGVWRQLVRRPTGSGTGTVLALAPRTQDLPGTSAEVRAIAALYGPAATVLEGRQATPSALVASGPGHDIVHLASLGVLNKHNPQFSYVELAPDRGGEGRLEVHDVGQMALNARLVVLSACQTGLGSGRVTDVPPGDDWVGLVQAFQAAGARNVLATLWPVDDRMTAELMREFYAALRSGASESAALATAQRGMLRTTAMRSPFYWAGFVLDGSI